MVDNVISFHYSGGDKIRLDQLISDQLKSTITPPPSRSFAQKLIESGVVLVNGKVCVKVGAKVDSGVFIELSLPEFKAGEIKPSDRKLEILFEDQHLMVINKPSGLSMHPGAGRDEDTLLNAVIGSLVWDDKSSKRPGIVHRLDMDTTGVVVVAKNPLVHSSLSQQFAERTINRTYQALVWTTPRGNRVVNKSESGVIDTQYGRHPNRRLEMSVLSKGGKRAVTNWKVEDRFVYGSLLRIKLETGRTHQIRVHLTHIGSPVIGDRTYGDFSGLPRELRRASDEFGRQALHAQELGFTHPVTGEVLKFEAPIPDDMQNLIEVFRTWR